MKRFISSLFRSRWQKKQDLASPARYYGDGGTIHSTGFLDVETYRGRVVSVWFRCQPLPFEQVAVDKQRADEMDGQFVPVAITGVEVLDK